MQISRCSSSDVTYFWTLFKKWSKKTSSFSSRDQKLNREKQKKVQKHFSSATKRQKIEGGEEK